MLGTQKLYSIPNDKSYSTQKQLFIENLWRKNNSKRAQNSKQFCTL
jgi:hypothetical protein